MRRILVALTVALAPGLGAAARADDPHAGHVHLSPEMEKCLAACRDCSSECGKCFVHCTAMVASGKKDHLTTLKTCVDCGDICALAAKLISRGGALVDPMCEGCAKACDACGAACAKFPDDSHMKACAKSCADCAKACREMLKK
jgi:hypothetical protein